MQIKLSLPVQQAKRLYDQKRYRRIRDKKLSQMRVYNRKHRKTLNALERARKARMGKTLVRAMARERYRRNAAKVAARNISYRYRGVTAPTRPMPTRCECCKGVTKRRLHVDHNHRTKRFRGWLCSNCNTGIGLLGDTINGVDQAVRFLRRFCD